MSEVDKSASNQVLSLDNKVRKKRHCLTMERRLSVIQQVKSGKSENAVAAELGVSRHQIQGIMKNEKKIIEGVNGQQLKLCSKVLVTTNKYPEIDLAVFNWFKQVRNPQGRCRPLPLSRSIIQARARLEAQRMKISEFKASDGWFARWRKRFNVGDSVALFGEAGDVDMAQAEEKMEQLRNKLSSQNYSVENIFNMDEAPLFYRAMPTRTYELRSESNQDKRQLGRGTKSLKAKDRLTLVLCCNATGSCKIDPLLIGSAKQPHCFRDGKCPVPYYSQKNAWMDRAAYKFWWELFLSNIRKWTREPVALIMDQCSGHDATLKDDREQVTVYFLPPNTTSIYQPLDQGIIASTKSRVCIKTRK